MTDHILKTKLIAKRGAPHDVAPDISGRDVRISPRTLDDWQRLAYTAANWSPLWREIVTNLILEVRHLRRELASARSQTRGGW